MEHFLCPNLSRDLRSDVHQSQFFGQDADEDHTQIIGEIQSNNWGNILSHFPRVSVPLCI